MNDNTGRDRRGLLPGLKNVAATLLTTGKTRLELLGNEIEAEKLRALRLLLLAQVMVFCFGVGTLLAVALTTALFWDNRLLVLGLSCVLFLALGGFVYTRFKRVTQRPPEDAVFAASIAELKEDLRQLKAAAGHET